VVHLPVADAVWAEVIGRYILKTPKRVGAIGRLREAEIASARTRRVSAGSMTPSSHRRALA
jgi:hypothetical protein